MVGHHKAKLERLATLGIVTYTGADGNEPVLDRFDVAVECTGKPEGFEMARQSLQPCGTLVMKSTCAGSLIADPSALVVDEITVVGSRCGPFDKALDLLASGAVEVRSLIAASYPLEEAILAFEGAGRAGRRCSSTTRPRTMLPYCPE